MAVGGVVLVLVGRGDDDEPRPDADAKPAREKAAAKPSPEGPAAERPADGDEPEKVLPESSCPPDLSNCVVASGRVVYVEAVDPDGDGDAHFVTISKENVTGAGLTIFDVRADLRPEPLPGVGDLVGGAGPVYPGHAGQKQIEVVKFHVAR